MVLNLIFCCFRCENSAKTDKISDKWQIEKLLSPIDYSHIVLNGSQHLHAITSAHLGECKCLKLFLIYTNHHLYFKLLFIIYI